MRVIKEFSKAETRISVFSWNNKYIVKYEQGALEQTFKVSEMDILEESDLDHFFEGNFFDLVLERFKEMGETLRNEIENF
ncbi:hypothetical protein P872_24370 [Rhodonellum psychrophilum GCM71 = DSM 17998]|uniref:Uncharacterized protein n=2 Tax=Rhodonellum TaxID=336827 RepID=U5C8M7_9BACT|nr:MULTISPECIES: hypothetical protein [Rhodonellum]ERM84557.1 hypothetical protein P872_24370 [Rhodonellum psychrophilum GCM71 = DSM 17998]SDY85108.1 hypothetical protein SAMN05444412_103142 [Rhodonellum ikkaensis]